VQYLGLKWGWRGQNFGFLVCYRFITSHVVERGGIIMRADNIKRVSIVEEMLRHFAFFAVLQIAEDGSLRNYTW